MYNPEKHHRKTIRLKEYDYSKNGLYFITICTYERVCCFGEVSNDIMQLNKLGHIVVDKWYEIPQHFPNSILHDFVVMPNHIHGIIEISNVTDYVQRESFENVNNFQKMIPKSISSIVKGFKIGVTKEYKRICIESNSTQNQLWQRNFYEHIIRSQESYSKISEYILNNPASWKNDKFHV